MERKEMQPFVGKVLASAFSKAEVDMKDPDHARRLCRVLIRGAARIAIRFGMPLPMWSAMCVDMMLTEAGTKYPADVPGEPATAGPKLYIVPEDEKKDLN